MAGRRRRGRRARRGRRRCETFEVNCFPPLFLTQRLPPLLRRSGAPRVVNLSSIRGSLAHLSDPTSPVYPIRALGYDTSKAALNAATILLAEELRGDARRSRHRQCGDGPAMDDQHHGGDRQYPRRRPRAAGRRAHHLGRPGLGTRIAFPGITDYAASKAAVVGYIKGAARDLGRRGITVNVVQAGIMDTDMAAGARDHLPPIVMDSHAIPRFAELSEVAAAMVFLAGPQAGFITGSVIDVNGGLTA